MKNIIVIFGGISPEHDVSIITGCLVLNSLDREKFNPVPVYVTKSGQFYFGKELFSLAFYKNFGTKKLKRVTLSPGENTLNLYKNNKPLFAVSGAINCMHGGYGENGTIGALFELCNIPCVTTGLFSAALSMDKCFTKTALKALDVKTVSGKKITRSDYYKDKNKTILDVVAELKLPIIVKPSATGSSIGIGVAKTYAELENCLFNAFRYGEKVLCERYVEKFTEINCAAYRSKGEIMVSELERPLSSNEILTFTDKYSGGKDGGSLKEFPAKLPDKIRDAVMATTKLIYEAFDFSSIVRMDYIIEGEDIFLNEINTVPGSMAYYLFKSKISGLTDLLTDLLTESFKNFLSKQNSLSDYDSDILSFKGMALKK